VASDGETRGSPAAKSCLAISWAPCAKRLRCAASPPTALVDGAAMRDGTSQYWDRSPGSGGCAVAAGVRRDPEATWPPAPRFGDVASAHASTPHTHRSRRTPGPVRAVSLRVAGFVANVTIIRVSCPKLPHPISSIGVSNPTDTTTRHLLRPASSRMKQVVATGLGRCRGPAPPPSSHVHHRCRRYPWQ
jgi:hypothetical protein